jgi:hypothetical protein
MARPTDVDYRDPDGAPVDPETGHALSLRERRANVVREIAVAGRVWFPLREEAQAFADRGEAIPDDLRDRLSAAEHEYRALEDELMGLMRPRVKDEWMYGGHRHGPDDAHDH